MYDAFKFLDAITNLTAHQWLVIFLEKAVVLRINLLQAFLKEVFTPSIALVKRFPIRWFSTGNTSLKAFHASVHQKFTWMPFNRLKRSFTVFLLLSPWLVLIFLWFDHNRHIKSILSSSCFQQNYRAHPLVPDGKKSA